MFNPLLWPLVMALLAMLFGPAAAHSSQRTQPLTHLSPVLNLEINTPDHTVAPEDSFSITLEIPSTDHYNYLSRRWVALADPNASSKFRKLASYFPMFKDYLFTSNDSSQQFTWADGSPVKVAPASAALSSEKLLHYLTKNSTLLEYPQDTQVFKITLQPNTELSDTSANVYTIDSKGNMVPHPDFTPRDIAKVYKGIAYRQVVSLNPSTGYLMKTFKRVGWARFVVVRDGKYPLVEGAWKVDDEEGLGTPAAIYHINPRDTFSAVVQTENLALPKRDYEILEDEQLLLASLEDIYGDEYTRMVVWRDADMSPVMYQNLHLLDDNYRDNKEYSLFETWSQGKFSKRGSVDLFDENDFEDPDYLFRYQTQLGGPSLFGRSGDTNDTGSQGFSSGMNLASTVGDTSGCPSRRMIALVGLAGDCSLLSSFNSTSSTREWLISIVNTASQIYETQLNVTLGISALVLVNETSCPTSSDSSSSTPWSYDCSTNVNTSMSDRLGLFSEWRGKRSDDGIAVWTLMTSCTQSSVVGLSWMGLLCGNGASGSSVAGTNVVARTQVGWRVYAHEVGHTFGAVHDCTSSACTQNLQASSQCCPLSSSTCDAAGAYIMNPASSSSQDKFSECTVGNICGALGRNSVNSTCLTSNTGVKLVTSNECGNGIVEEGEECDCGGTEGCAGNSCCDPTTCKFKSGAQCDDANEECCSGCKFQSSSTICRASTGPCDYDITCPGDSSTCPAAKYKETGTSCTLSNSTFKNLECISGHCTSRDLQCVTLLGNTTLTLNGNVVNVTRSCTDDSSCQLSCVDPTFGSMCILTSQNFLDGTPCKSTGRCSMGRCIGGTSSGSGSGFLDDPGSWLSNHKGTVIAICVSIGAFIILMIIMSIFRRWFYRYRQRKMMGAALAANARPKPPAGGYAVPPPYAAAGIYTQRAMHPPPPPPPPIQMRHASASASASVAPPAAAAPSPWGSGAGAYSNYNYGGGAPTGYYPEQPQQQQQQQPLQQQPLQQQQQQYEMSNLGGTAGNGYNSNSSYGGYRGQGNEYNSEPLGSNNPFASTENISQPQPPQYSYTYSGHQR
ncbi:uncharacterized protein SAPINGB_P002916 [Magnusiomyces paraingens]|uniref:Disintegrin and metalloproteinase domain-containing protein B n=1 Tax=Magnusiomyces paraingens TaxID=2606893 RepID=A0A5E8BGV2_9ASCO|nr:uncharacterized protein SAPINGB_P002916 [Saprochaete ingens]VVT50896.1 unnamed protein product [Saprochaete ingens]